MKDHLLFEYPIRMSWDIGRDRTHYVEAMDSLVRAGVFFIGFSGQPFQWEKFPELVSYAAEKGIWAMASTSMWDTDTVEKINTCEIGEVGLLTDTKVNLENLAETLPSIAKPVSVSIVLKKVEVERPIHIVRQILQLPVQRVYIAPYFRYVNPPLSETDKKRYKTLVLKAKELRRESHVIIQDAVACPLMEVPYAGGHSTMCPAGTSTCHLDGNLDVYPCPRWRILCGSLKEQTMKTIWKESDALKKIRTISLKGVSCPHFAQCLGGCRAVVDAAGLSLNECDPDCLMKGDVSE